jgi:TatD DNase family protein
MYIDSHAHLEMDPFDEDRTAVIERASADGIEAILAVGTNLVSSRAAIALAQRHPQLYPTAGFHPHDAAGVTQDMWLEIEELLQRPDVIAAGEMGLDYFKRYSPLDEQRQVFRRQLRLAQAVGKPAIIHCRNAGDDVLAILREEHAEQCGGVMHCFSGDLALAEACLDLGLYISFAGPITFRNAEELRTVAKAIPMDRLLVETDCPFLAPAPRRGKRNEPSYVRHTAARLAELHGVSVEEAARCTTANARRLFKLPANSAAGESQAAQPIDPHTS